MPRWHYRVEWWSDGGGNEVIADAIAVVLTFAILVGVMGLGIWYIVTRNPVIESRNEQLVKLVDEIWDEVKDRRGDGGLADLIASRIEQFRR